MTIRVSVKKHYPNKHFYLDVYDINSYKKQNLNVFKDKVLFNVLNQTEKLINSYIEHFMN